MVSFATTASRFRTGLEFKTILFASVVIVLGFSVIYPFVLLLISTFITTRPFEPTEYGLDQWRFALTDPGMLEALWNTVVVMFVRQGISFPIAIFICWLIARTDMPGGKTLEVLFWVAFFLPVVPVVQAWILLAHPGAGLLNIWIEKLPFIDDGPFNIYSFWGIIWVHLATNTIAIKVMLLTPAFRNLDASLEEAARVGGATSLRTLARVTVPVLTPAIIMMLMLSVLRAAQSVEIEVILGTPIQYFIFGSKIFSLFGESPPRYEAAAAMGIVVLTAFIPFIVASRWISIRKNYTTVSGRYRPQVLALGQWRWGAFALVATIAVGTTVLPVGIILMGTFMRVFGFFDVPTGTWSFIHWERILTDSVFLLSVKNTLILGLSAATISVTFFAIVAYMVVRLHSRLRAVLDFLVWVPYVLPGIILALAWLIIFLRVPFLRPLYGSMTALIIVTALGGITVTVQILKAGLLQLGFELEEAASVAGGSWFFTFRRVVLPLLAPALVVVWVLNFVSAAGNAILPAILASPSSRTLALLQFEQVTSGRDGEATVVGVIIVLLTLGPALLARMLGFRIGVRS